MKWDYPNIRCCRNFNDIYSWQIYIPLKLNWWDKLLKRKATIETYVSEDAVKWFHFPTFTSVEEASELRRIVRWFEYNSHIEDITPKLNIRNKK